VEYCSSIRLVVPVVKYTNLPISGLFSYQDARRNLAVALMRLHGHKDIAAATAALRHNPGQPWPCLASKANTAWPWASGQLIARAPSRGTRSTRRVTRQVKNRSRI
jgi:hypothetical protein